MVVALCREKNRCSGYLEISYVMFAAVSTPKIKGCFMKIAFSVLMAVTTVLTSPAFAYYSEKTEVVAVCTLTSDVNSAGNFNEILGAFEVHRIVDSSVNENIGKEFGEIFVNGYNASSGKLAKKNTGIQIDINREAGEPYVVQFWGMTPARATEAVVTLKSDTLPSSLTLSHGPQFGAQQSMGRTQLSCKASESQR